ETVVLVEADPRQLLPPLRQLVAAPRELLLRGEQLEPRCQPLFACPGHVSCHRSSLRWCSMVVRQIGAGHRTVGVTSVAGFGWNTAAPSRLDRCVNTDRAGVPTPS